MATIDTVSIPRSDNWPIRRQLWQSGDKLPGMEQSLSEDLGRELSVRWVQDDTDEVVFESSDAIAIINAVLGVVEIIPPPELWQSVRRDRPYRVEVWAYGSEGDRFGFHQFMPEPQSVSLDGVAVYASPSQVLDVLGMVPGADVMTAIDISEGWESNELGYWVRPLPETLHGVWVDNLYLSEYPYSELGVCDRGYARHGGTLYLKGHDLSLSTVETAYSERVLRLLNTATAQIERQTARFFNRRRVIRETHRGLKSQKQIYARQTPIAVDAFFRLDAFSSLRTYLRSYTELSISHPQYRNPAASHVHVEHETGCITIAHSFWDAPMELDPGVLGWTSYLPPGDNNIEITYTAGGEIPYEITEAVSLLAAVSLSRYWQQSITQGMQGITLGCVSLNFGELFKSFTPDWISRVNCIVAGHQRVSIEGF